MSDNIREVQLRQKKLVNAIHERCVENNIKYTMLGGTLLGAVRHKGFIPWDDDLDIGLPREDYEKLIKSLIERPIEGCFLQTYETDKHFVQPFAKLRLDDTLYLEKWFDRVDMHQGIFIDIFPLDKIKKPGSFSTEFRRLLCKELTFSVWFKEKCHIRRKGIKKLETIVSAVLSLLPKKFVARLQKSLADRSCKDWNYYGSIYSSNYPTEKVYFDKKDFDNLILFDFEDIKLYGVASYDAVLTRMFKNYMELPPEGKRNSGHNLLKVEF